MVCITNSILQFIVAVSLKGKDNPVCYPTPPVIFFAHFSLPLCFLTPPTTEKFLLILKETVGSPEVRLETVWHQHLQSLDFVAVLQSPHPSSMLQVLPTLKSLG